MAAPRGSGDASRQPKDLTGYALLSIATSLTTLGLKLAACFATSSVGLLSDALESIVNLVAACLALAMLRLAQCPPDEGHEFGHEKAEYFSSGAEGGLILVAALSIVGSAVGRFLHPIHLTDLGMGSLLSGIATLLNGAVAMVLIRAGKRYRSVTLIADGHHLLSDVWTSLALLSGIALIAWTGREILDPIAACLAALAIGFTGLNLMRQAFAGLLDAALSPEERSKIEQALEYLPPLGATYHALRTRRSGQAAFVQLHVLVPGDWEVSRGHQLLEGVETAIQGVLPGARVITHLEPMEDPASFSDLDLDNAARRVFHTRECKDDCR